MMLLDLWKGPLPSGLEKFYQAARKIKDSTPERATWAALRMYLLFRGQPMNLCRDELPALVARARRA